ncbi:MAG: hypothetical protein WCT08_02730 [Patescibacteria group bacterium]|jgi:hypothetical protein
MALQVSTIIDLTNAGVTGYLAFRLYSAFVQNPKSQTLKNFFYLYSMLAIAYIFLFVPRIIASDQTRFLGYSFAVGNCFFLIAAAFYGKIILFFTKPQWAKKFFVIFLILTGIGLVRAFYEPAKPFVDSTTGITNWNVDLALGIYYGIMILAILIPGIIFFLTRGIQAKTNHVVRIRSNTIAIGTILLIFTVITFYLANTETLAILGDLFSVAALLTVFLGVIYHRPKPIPQIMPNNSLNNPKE